MCADLLRHFSKCIVLVLYIQMKGQEFCLEKDGSAKVVRSVSTQ